MAVVVLQMIVKASRVTFSHCSTWLPFWSLPTRTPQPPHCHASTWKAYFLPVHKAGSFFTFRPYLKEAFSYLLIHLKGLSISTQLFSLSLPYSVFIMEQFLSEIAFISCLLSIHLHYKVSSKKAKHLLSYSHTNPNTRTGLGQSHS